MMFGLGRQFLCMPASVIRKEFESMQCYVDLTLQVDARPDASMQEPPKQLLALLSRDSHGLC
jgi:hypothetical protein